MKNFKLIISIILLSFIISLQSCSDDNNDEMYMWIAAERPLAHDDNSGVERPFYKYKLKESDDWKLLYPLIIGFNDYEEGYEYLLLVKNTKVKNPAQDQYPERYTLLEIVSKIKKDGKK